MTARTHDALYLMQAWLVTLLAFVALVGARVAAESRLRAILAALLLSVASWIECCLLKGMANRPTRMATLQSRLTGSVASTLWDLVEVVYIPHLSGYLMKRALELEAISEKPILFEIAHHVDPELFFRPYQAIGVAEDEEAVAGS